MKLAGALPRSPCAHHERPSRRYATNQRDGPARGLTRSPRLRGPYPWQRPSHCVVSVARPRSSSRQRVSALVTVVLLCRAVPTAAMLGRGHRSTFCVWSVCIRAAGEAHRKHRALAWLARHGDIATHHACQLAGDGKAQSCATVTARGKRIGLGKSWNSFVCCSAVMPMPLSATASPTQSRPSSTLRTRSATSPSFVNLQALLKRLSRICLSRSD
jgi:hypothetical protein